MRKGSIAFSLFWLSAGWLILALAGTAFLLTNTIDELLETGDLVELDPGDPAPGR